MLKAIKLFLIFLVFTCLSYGQALVEIPITFSDGVGNSKILIVGLDPSATDGQDFALGEIDAPPPPPSGAFDVRFTLPGTTIQTFKDIRQGDNTGASNGDRIHTINFQLGTGSTGLTINWDLPVGVGLNLKDPFGGTIFNVDYPENSKNNYTITNTSLTSFILTIKYNYQQHELTLTSPNGGENWQTGSLHNITWTSTDVDNVKIEFSTDNGTNWMDLFQSTPSSGLYSWTVPNTPSTNCKIRISDASNPSINDESDSVFTISSPSNQTITITSPNGGENWQTYSSHNITWTSTNVDNVKIEFSTDNGTNWMDLFQSTPSNGLYPWTVPNTPSTNCKIRISDASNSSINDESDSVFTIQSTHPRAADFEKPGDFIDIPNSPTINPAQFTIEFWLKVKELGDPNAAGGEQNILDIRGNNNSGYVIRLAGTKFPISLFAFVNPGGVSTIETINQNVWNHIAVTQSKDTLKIYLNGELVEASANLYNSNTDSQLRIGDCLAYPNVYLGLHGDIDELRIWNTVHSQKEIQSEMFSKLTGTESGLTAYWDFDSQFDKSIHDLTSDGNNGTLNGNVQLIDSDAPIGLVPPVVVAPNGGENWEVGSSHNITWTSSKIKNVMLYYSTNNGSNWKSIVQSVTNTGIYNWTIPNTSSAKCKVKISDILYSFVNDQSDNVFTISAVPEITLASPNGGEDWKEGSKHNITWTCVNVANVNIDYSLDGGASWSNIISNIPAAPENYSWTVPNISSTRVKIRISEVSNSSVMDVSDNTFTISSITKINDEYTDKPSVFILEDNYPNPFNPTTKISWQSPIGSRQTLKVYDVLGNEIATLVDEYRPAGKYETIFNAESLPSGIYFYKLTAGAFTSVKKMLLLK